MLLECHYAIAYMKLETHYNGDLLLNIIKMGLEIVRIVKSIP